MIDSLANLVAEADEVHIPWSMRRSFRRLGFIASSCLCISGYKPGKLFLCVHNGPMVWYVLEIKVDWGIASLKPTNQRRLEFSFCRLVWSSTWYYNIFEVSLLYLLVHVELKSIVVNILDTDWSHLLRSRLATSLAAFV